MSGCGSLHEILIPLCTRSKCTDDWSLFHSWGSTLQVSYMELTWLPSKNGSLASISCKRTSPLTCVLHILNVDMKSTFCCMYRPPILGSISGPMLWFVACKKVSPQVVYDKYKVWRTIACSHFIKFNLHSMQLTFTH